VIADVEDVACGCECECEFGEGEEEETYWRLILPPRELEAPALLNREMLPGQNRQICRQEGGGNSQSRQ